MEHIMESILWVRRTRNKVLNRWYKRYFVLLQDGRLQEYTFTTTMKKQIQETYHNNRQIKRLQNINHPIHKKPTTLAQDLLLKQETFIIHANVSISTISTVGGRLNVFYIELSGGKMKLCLSASDDTIRTQWINALNRIVHSQSCKISQDTLINPIVSNGLLDILTIPMAMTHIESYNNQHDPFLQEINIYTIEDLSALLVVVEWLSSIARISRVLHLSSPLNTSRMKTTSMESSKRRFSSRMWRNHSNTRKQTRITIEEGAIILAVNGISMQTTDAKDRNQLQELLFFHPSQEINIQEQRLPLTLLIRCKSTMKGLLHTKIRSHQISKVNGEVELDQENWQLCVVELDGDMLTCVPQGLLPNEKHIKRIISLVPRYTKVLPLEYDNGLEGHFFIIIVGDIYSIVFQATDADTQNAWIQAIESTIAFEYYALNFYNKENRNSGTSLGNLQLESSMNMRHSVLASNMNHGFSEIPDERDTEDEEEEEDDDDALPEEQLLGMLEFLQPHGRFTEALQLMHNHSSMRKYYWRQIFAWAMENEEPLDEKVYQTLLNRPLADADVVQLEKDIPRTAKWLVNSDGAPAFDSNSSSKRLEQLNRMLHAFLSSCSQASISDQFHESSIFSPTPLLISPGRSPRLLIREDSYYMQGMNGIAFILLHILADEENQTESCIEEKFLPGELESLQFFRGLITRVLPQIFGITTSTSLQDITAKSKSKSKSPEEVEFFTSLESAGTVLDNIVASHLPKVHRILEDADIPVCLLAYKWFPTLFSDISLTAHQSQLQYVTLLSIWDICLLLGVEGIFTVALALFSSAENAILQIAQQGERSIERSLHTNGSKLIIRPISAEVLSATFVNVLVNLSPEDLITSVCEILEMCNHPTLLKLRNEHHRILNKHIATQKNILQAKDLDSGKYIKLSKDGKVLSSTK